MSQVSYLHSFEKLCIRIVSFKTWSDFLAWTFSKEDKILLWHFHFNFLDNLYIKFLLGNFNLNTSKTFDQVCLMDRSKLEFFRNFNSEQLFLVTSFQKSKNKKSKSIYCWHIHFFNSGRPVYDIKFFHKCKIKKVYSFIHPNPGHTVYKTLQD